jgi:hypothetical protein
MRQLVPHGALSPPAVSAGRPAIGTKGAVVVL